MIIIIIIILFFQKESIPKVVRLNPVMKYLLSVHANSFIVTLFKSHITIQIKTFWSIFNNDKSARSQCWLSYKEKGHVIRIRSEKWESLIGKNLQRHYKTMVTERHTKWVILMVKNLLRHNKLNVRHDLVQKKSDFKRMKVWQR